MFSLTSGECEGKNLWSWKYHFTLLNRPEFILITYLTCSHVGMVEFSLFIHNLQVRLRSNSWQTTAANPLGGFSEHLHLAVIYASGRPDLGDESHLRLIYIWKTGARRGRHGRVGSRGGEVVLLARCQNRFLYTLKVFSTRENNGSLKAVSLSVQSDGWKYVFFAWFTHNTTVLGVDSPLKLSPLGLKSVFLHQWWLHSSVHWYAVCVNTRNILRSQKKKKSIWAPIDEIYKNVILELCLDLCHCRMVKTFCSLPPGWGSSSAIVCWQLSTHLRLLINPHTVFCTESIFFFILGNQKYNNFTDLRSSLLFALNLTK